MLKDRIRRRKDPVNTCCQSLVDGLELIDHREREGGHAYLCERELLTPAIKRSLPPNEQRLKLLRNGTNQLLPSSIPLRLRSRTNTSPEMRQNLAEEGIDEERETGAI